MAIVIVLAINTVMVIVTSLTIETVMAIVTILIIETNMIIMTILAIKTNIHSYYDDTSYWNQYSLFWNRDEYHIQETYSRVLSEVAST